MLKYSNLVIIHHTDTNWNIIIIIREDILILVSFQTASVTYDIIGQCGTAKIGAINTTIIHLR